MSRLYIVYDGRATVEGPGAAMEMECFTADRDKQAISEARETWDGYEWVMFSYDYQGDILTDERYVTHSRIAHGGGSSE